MLQKIRGKDCPQCFLTDNMCSCNRWSRTCANKWNLYILIQKPNLTHSIRQNERCCVFASFLIKLLHMTFSIFHKCFICFCIQLFLDISIAQNLFKSCRCKIWRLKYFSQTEFHSIKIRGYMNKTRRTFAVWEFVLEIIYGTWTFSDF